MKEPRLESKKIPLTKEELERRIYEKRMLRKASINQEQVDRIIQALERIADSLEEDL